MVVVIAVVSGVLGLILGWVANMVIDRVPEGEGLLGPAPVSPRPSGQESALRYPAVVIALGLLFAVTSWLFSTMDPPDYWVLPGMLLFVWMLTVIAVIDYRTRRIPNALTYPLTPALLVLLSGAAVLNGVPGRVSDVVIGAVGAFVFLLLLALINPRGMGMGDVKYAAFLGLGLGYLGLGTVVVGIVGAFVLGSVISLGLVTARVRTRKDTIPFGPFLSLGALLGMWFGPTIVEAYLRSG